MLEREWIERIQRGDLSGYEPLLEGFQGLLHSMAMRVCPPEGMVTQAELVQSGYIGIMHAAKSFDYNSGVKFITYAFPWALGEMKRTMCKSSVISGASLKRRFIAKQELKLNASLLREPRLSELADACSMSEQEIMQVLEATSPQSLDCVSAKEGTSLLDRLPGSEGLNLEVLDLHMAMDKLPDIERSVLMLRFFRGNTQREAAQILGKSQPQISKLENRALDLLRAVLKETRPEEASSQRTHRQRETGRITATRKT